MKTLYFDAFAGASGDMTLGALVAAGVDERQLIERLRALDASGAANWQLRFERVNRSGISATRAIVETGHEHRHRHLKDILKIIGESQLSDGVKERAASIFTRLAEAEARVHNEPIERIHFHEVGALDAIVDVVGACIGFELLGIKRFAASALHTGSGMVEMAHGRFPVPPPAVTELLRGVPVYSSDIEGELLTPTGAAIISTVCDGAYGAMPLMKITSVGYGAGEREYRKFPNVLRLIVGETMDSASQPNGGAVNPFAGEHEPLTMLETNIDDASGQLIGYVMERAFACGALDCYFTSVQMKKNRPGVLISILCRNEEAEALRQMLFTETTTLGVRSYEVGRYALDREFVKVETEFGAIDVKVARLHENGSGEVLKSMPEYEQCNEAATRAGVPLKEVEAAARKAFTQLRSEEAMWNRIERR